MKRESWHRSDSVSRAWVVSCFSAALLASCEQTPIAVSALTSSCQKKESRSATDAGTKEQRGFSVVNGTAADNADQLERSTAGIMVVQTLNSGGKSARICTGVVAGRNVILTAAHCLSKGEGVTSNWYGITFSSTTRGLTIQDYLEVAEAVPHPQHDGYNNDIAILRLKEPVPSTQIVPSFVELPASLVPRTPVTGVGYGASGTGRADGGTKLRFNAEVVNLITEANYPSAGRVFRNLIRIKDTSTLRQGTCNGDSGGPGFLKDSPQVFGLVFGTVDGVQPNPDSCEEPDSNYTLVAPFIAWVESKVGYELNTSGKAILVDSSPGWGILPVPTVVPSPQPTRQPTPQPSPKPSPKPGATPTPTSTPGATSSTETETSSSGSTETSAGPTQSADSNEKSTSNSAGNCD